MSDLRELIKETRELVREARMTLEMWRTPAGFVTTREQAEPPVISPGRIDRLWATHDDKAWVKRQRQRPQEGWFADIDEESATTSDKWRPFLQVHGCCFPVEIWFGSEADCVDWIKASVLGQALLDDPGAPKS